MDSSDLHFVSLVVQVILSKVAELLLTFAKFSTCSDSQRCVGLTKQQGVFGSLSLIMNVLLLSTRFKPCVSMDMQHSIKLASTDKTLLQVPDT